VIRPSHLAIEEDHHGDGKEEEKEGIVEIAVSALEWDRGGLCHFRIIIEGNIFN